MNTGEDPAHWQARREKKKAENPNLGDLHLGASVAAQMFGGTGGSLWPVTESEPGRVAKLRAIGNAVVPAWVVAGPFQRILELEEGSV